MFRDIGSLNITAPMNAVVMLDGTMVGGFSAIGNTGFGIARVTLDAGSKGISPDVEPPACKIVGWPGLDPQRASEEHYG